MDPYSHLVRGVVLEVVVDEHDVELRAMEARLCRRDRRNNDHVVFVGSPSGGTNGRNA